MSQSPSQQIFLGSDHGGFQLKEEIKRWLLERGYQVKDLGANQLDPDDDYPLFAAKVARAVNHDNQAVGILFCRSGGGMTITANKLKGIRAVDVMNEVGAKHAKEHNNANIIALAADWISLDQAKKIVDTFLSTSFAYVTRHLRRIQQIAQIEQEY